MANITIKYKFNGKMKRFNVNSSELTWDGLIETISKSFNLEDEVKNNLSVCYRDDEGDIITLGSNEELMEAVRLTMNGQSGKLKEPTLRLKIHVLDSKGNHEEFQFVGPSISSDESESASTTSNNSHLEESTKVENVDVVPAVEKVVETSARLEENAKVENLEVPTVENVFEQPVLSPEPKISTNPWKEEENVNDPEPKVDSFSKEEETKSNPWEQSANPNLLTSLLAGFMNAASAGHSSEPPAPPKKQEEEKRVPTNKPEKVDSNLSIEFAKVLKEETNVKALQDFLSTPRVLTLVTKLAKAYHESGGDIKALSTAWIEPTLSLLPDLVKLFASCPQILTLIPESTKSLFEHFGEKVEKSKSSEQSSVLHFNIICDACEGSCSPNKDTTSDQGFIVGDRFKSAVVENFDLCSSCESTGKFEKSHGPFLKIRTPSQAPKGIFCVLSEEDDDVGPDEDFNWRKRGNCRRKFRKRVQEMKNGRRRHGARARAQGNHQGPLPFLKILRQACRGKGPGNKNEDVCAKAIAQVVEAISTREDDNDVELQAALQASILTKAQEEIDEIHNNLKSGAKAGDSVQQVPRQKEKQKQKQRHREIPSAKFVQDVTLPDASVLKPNKAYFKIWKVKNNGNSPWPQNSRLVCVGGDLLGTSLRGIEAVALEQGLTTELSLPIITPSVPGRYVSYWRLITDRQERFGDRLWIDVVVSDQDSETSLPSNEKQEGENVEIKPRKFEAKLRVLETMGFKDIPGLYSLLAKNDGDIGKTVNEILEN